MGRLVAIAALLVGDPAQIAAIRHPHAHFLARARHARNVERRGGDDGTDLGDERFLRGAVEIAGQVPETGRKGEAPPSVEADFAADLLDGGAARPWPSAAARPSPLSAWSSCAAWAAVRRPWRSARPAAARASSRFCSCVRKRPASMTMTPSLVARWPASLIVRSRTRSDRRRRTGRVEAQLDGGRDLVDVLAAGPGGADELLLELALGDLDIRRDEKPVARAHVFQTMMSPADFLPMSGTRAPSSG